MYTVQSSLWSGGFWVGWTECLPNASDVVLIQFGQIALMYIDYDGNNW